MTDRPAPPPRLAWVVLAGATLALIALGFAAPSILGAWRLAIVFLAGLALGSLALFMVGKLLRNDWLDAIDDELVPAAWSIALIAVLALPLLALPAPDPVAVIGEARMAPLRAAWFDPEAMLVRLGCAFLLWIGLCAVAARRGASRFVNAVGLALLAASFSGAVVDWVILARPFWWSSMLPFAFAISQMTAALAIAFVAHLAQREREPIHRFRSLASALLALALLGLWLWFVQYLIAWMANLPMEAAWYAVRMIDGGAAILIAAAGLQIAAILMLIGFERSRREMLAASVALLAAHLLHSLWLLRPTVPTPLDWSGIAILLLLVLLWAGWLAAGVRLYDARFGSDDGEAPPHPDARGRDRRRNE